MATPGGPPPQVPEGWQVNWSDQYNQWFYVHPATNASQWEYPTGPEYACQPATTPQPTYYAPPQPQSAEQGVVPPPTNGEPAPADRGIMGKMSNLNPKAQTALAVGGGLAAGALLEHKIDEFSEHHHGRHQGLDTMAGLLGAAGAGELGAKIGKFFGGKHQAAQAGPHPVPVPAAPVPAAPGAASLGPGFGGLGNFASGGAAVLAGSGVSNLLHHSNQGGAPSGTTTGAEPGGMGSFFGGPLYSGPHLIIYAATYADRDVTERARTLVTPDQVFSLDCKQLSDEFGDPWPENKRKMFSVLYQYGDRPLEVWAGSTGSGRVDIRHEALSNARMAYISKDPGRIVCLIWGQESILSKERVSKLETDGELDCSGLGNGGFYGWEQRNLICYYRTPHGGIGIGHGREDGTLRLPWNPLAKWS